jgi:hypothetical protein
MMRVKLFGPSTDKKMEEIHVMAKPARGDKVLVPTEAKSGAFPGEKLVTVSTESGPVSGFARSNDVVDQGGGTFLRAEVLDVSSNTLTVKLRGSFFTTTGRADIPMSAARRELAG